MVQARNDHKNAVKERIDEVGQMKDLVDVTKALFELSRETAKLEAEAFELKQQVAVASEVKSTLDTWVRHEAQIREREQKQLAAYLIEKVNKQLEDPKVQQELLDQAIVDIQSKFWEGFIEEGDIKPTSLFFFLFRCCQVCLNVFFVEERCVCTVKHMFLY